MIFSSIVACLLAIGVWVLYTLRTSPGSFSIFLSFIAIAFASEGLLLRFRGQQILPRGRVEEDLRAWVPLTAGCKRRYVPLVSNVTLGRRGR